MGALSVLSTIDKTDDEPINTWCGSGVLSTIDKTLFPVRGWMTLSIVGKVKEDLVPVRAWVGVLKNLCQLLTNLFCSPCVGGFCVLSRFVNN